MLMGLWSNSMALPVFASTRSFQSNTVNKSLKAVPDNQHHPNASLTRAVNSPLALSKMLRSATDVSGMTRGLTLQNNHATTSTWLDASADVSAYAMADSYWVASGSTITYTVEITNFGPDAASSVTLAGTLPPGVTLGTITNAYGSCTTGSGAGGGTDFDCTLGSSDPYVSKTITFTGTASGAAYTLLPFVASAGSPTPDPSDWNNEAETEARIASAPVPSPTPGPTNEAQLAYISTGNNNSTDIFRRRADGAGLVNLTNNAANEDSFIWSPDGSQLAFLRYDFENFIVSLCVVDADGSNLAVLTNVTEEYISYFNWSPDGNKLVFNAHDFFGDGTEGEVYVINADGTGRVSLSGANGFNTEPKWSPDGTKVSYLRITYSQESDPINAIYVSNANGTNQIEIPHDEGEMDFNAAWSPDSERLVFTRCFSDNTEDIFTVEADGTDLLRLTNDSYLHYSTAQWSPDGTKLLFTSNLPGGLTIETINADGTGRTTLYSPPQGSSNNAGSEKWSPDSTKVAFHYIVGEFAGGNICVVNANGTGLQCLGNALDYNLDPDWSPDSTRLAFTSNRNGVPSIDIINSNGTGRVELTSQADSYGAPRWRPQP
jgi:uncharacterized repeat protein (TIGR01451 family)